MAKKVGFAGHGDIWRCVNIEEPLKRTIKELVDKGYTYFFDGGLGYFDKISANIVMDLRKDNSDIKIARVLAFYSGDRKYNFNEDAYNEIIFPDLEKVYLKQRIEKRNQWIVENSDILVCHVIDTFNSGAYKTLKYAKKLGKTIIYV